MANITVNLLYNELRRLRKEVHEIRTAVIPEEEISNSERRELRSLFRQIERGKGIPWRKPRKK